MTNLLPLAGRWPSDQAVHVRYEKAGLTVYGQPVPWCADAVVVEILARLPPSARLRTDFLLRMPGVESVPAEAVRKDDTTSTKYRVFFRLPVPNESVVAEVLWKHRLLATVPLDIQNVEQFTADLRLTAPTVAVRLGGQSVAAQTFVASQCHGMTAAVLLRAATPLAPLADLGVRVVFRSDRGGEQTVAVPLTSSQLASKEALVVASPARFPRRAGTYSITWLIGGRELLTQRVTAINSRRFVQSLRVSDARFVIADKVGPMRSVRTVPSLAEVARVGPCFVLASREPGAAGLLSLQVAATVPGAVHPPAVFDQSVLVTDGPTLFAPGLVEVSDLAGSTGFELRHNGQVLGVMSLSPVPSAAVNAEGGFKPPPDFAWTNAAEEELTDRLGKLLGGPDAPPNPPAPRPW